MVPDARAIFVKWFNNFATRKEEFEDGDGLTEERYLSRENFVDFMRSIQKSLNSMNSSTIFAQSPSFQQIYKEFDNDQDGRLTCDEFIAFFRSKCESNENTVWRNLEQFGFGRDLYLKSDSDCKYDEDPLI